MGRFAACGAWSTTSRGDAVGGSLAKLRHRSIRNVATGGRAGADRAVRRAGRQIHVHRAELCGACGGDGREGAGRARAVHEGHQRICGPNDDLQIPRNSKKTDWEVELGVVIGDRAKYVDEAKALDHVAGYCVVHDVSEREFQMERCGQWDKGKGCDTFGPIGPWLVTKDEVPDPQSLQAVARGRRRANAERHHADDDLWREEACELFEPIHDAASGRHHHDGHAIGRRHEPQAAACSCGRGKRCGWASRGWASSSSGSWQRSDAIRLGLARFEPVAILDRSTDRETSSSDCQSR